MCKGVPFALPFFKTIWVLTKLVLSRWLDIGQVPFCVFMDRDEVEVHKLEKKERGQYPAILTEQAWSIKDLLHSVVYQPINHRNLWSTA